MLKRIGERALVGSGMAARFARRRPRRFVLAYHNILPDGTPSAGDRSLHLTRARFAAQLDLLAREARVVPLGLILAPTAPVGTDRRPLVALTFDDAYAGAVLTGVGELAARGLPATICVAPGFLGGRSFWWDALASGEGGLGAATRETVLADCRGDDASARAWAAARGHDIRNDLGPPFRCATESELASALEHPGISLASHTWSHPNLARLEPDDLRQELERSREWLQRFGPRAEPVVTWPYGLHSAAARSLAAEAGYQAGFRVDGGELRDGADRFALPRLNVPAGLSPEGLLLRLAGLVGGGA
ncbi:MAG TPA: polysaccharide deacetylase family protein [Gemmatimonadales bacterium]|nr:polysaccharide deacetylase family protein [Gemmatimonadales bacterium]